MIGLKGIQLVINLLTLFLAYILVISPVGYFRAWVAKRMGDNTGEDLGFLTLNPAAHIDFVGVMVLVLFGVGWGKHIPVNHHNIHGPRRGLKIASAYFSDTAANMLLASIALVLFIGLFGAQSLGIYATSVSSLGISVARIIVAFIHLNVFLAAIGLVLNAVMLTALYIAERNLQIPSYFYYFILLAPIVVLIIFGEEIRLLMMTSISALGDFMASLLRLK